MKSSTIAVWACVVCTLPGLIGNHLAGEAAGQQAPPVRWDSVDYRHYALDSWISAIGLPDDAYKCVADADGRFLAELGGGHSHQGVYPDRPPVHPVMIQADLLGGARRVDQRMHAPRVPVVITRKCQGDVAVTETLLLARPLDWSAKARGANRQGRDSQPDARQYLLMAEYVNQGARPVEIVPVINIGGVKPEASRDESRTSFRVSANTRCRTSQDVQSLVWSSASRARATLKKMVLRPGASARVVLAIDRNGYSDPQPVDLARAETLRQQAVAYWEKSSVLPYDVVQIPDPEIQALVDTSIRELYQMRYVIQDLPAYFFGPGCYNDYWILDGSFVSEAMDILGRGSDVDGYADYLLLHQQADGKILTLRQHWKETGIALLTLYRHALLTRNKAWLAARWPQFSRAVESIRQLRRTGSSADPQAPNYKLSQPGFGDGGVGVGADYTNNHWLLAGLKAAVEAARWLERTEDAQAWEAEYADYQETFQRAIRRDAKIDAHGNRYIPAVMGPAAPKYPARGQWAFCQGVYPGEIFAPDDPLMLGTMKMLEANEVQGGIVENSGWIGIWAQCGSFYGHDWLWLGDGRRAARLLYAFANHASPVHNWREEMPRQTRPGEKFPYGKGSGDMPHVSAAAEFIRLAVHLIELDRGDELHLLEGMPARWLGAGMTTRLDGVATPFGPLHLSVHVSPDGKTATVEVRPLAGNCKSVVVHRPDGSTCRMVPQQGGKVVFGTLLATSPLGRLPAEEPPGIADATTLRGKVMCGYQGWFRCPGDSSDQGWTHWSRDFRRLTPETLHVDLWPDMSEYSAAERFAAPGFSYEDGSPAHLFSSHNAATVLRHFQWMRDYGIDGAWVQHFLVGLPDGPVRSHYPSRRRVMEYASAAAQQTGRVWALSYDTAAMPLERIFASLTADWKRLVDEGTVAGPRYLHHNGRPVVQIWGFYWNNKHDPMDAATANRLIDFFHTPGRYAAFLVGGGTWDWRRVPDPQWQAFFRRFDAYSPWIVGNQLIDKQGISHPGTQRWADDLRECQSHGMLFLPVVYPGFSWINLMNHAPGTVSISRREGRFLWEQFVTLAKLKVDCAYLAMFDEVDEGTAIFKLASSKRVDGPVIHRDRTYPSDWYLQLVREGARMIHGRRPISEEIPIKPSQLMQ